MSPQPLATAGQEPSLTTQVQEGVQAGLKSITPQFIIIGILTGAAFAIGAGLINHYVFADKGKKKR